MITLKLDRDGRLIATQQDMSPSVYLDQWALMDIAQDAKSSERFSSILIQKKGTLYISSMNLLEFSLVRDPRHVVEVEKLLEPLSPHIFFIDCIPKNVIERENQLIKGEGPVVAPHEDIKLLKYFIALKPQTLDPLNPKGLFSNLRQPRLEQMCKGFLQKSTADINKLRQKREKDPKYKARIQDIPRATQQQHATRLIYQDLINSLIRDEIKLQDSNHYIDLHHTVVPVAYGDFCLLDKTWAAKANQTIARLRQVGHIAQMAKIFSKRTMGEFWVALQSYT